MTAISQPSLYDQHSPDVIYKPFVFLFDMGHQNKGDVGA